MLQSITAGFRLLLRTRQVKKRAINLLLIPRVKNKLHVLLAGFSCCLLHFSASGCCSSVTINPNTRFSWGSIVVSNVCSGGWTLWVVQLDSTRTDCVTSSTQDFGSEVFRLASCGGCVQSVFALSSGCQVQMNRAPGRLVGRCIHR